MWDGERGNDIEASVDMCVYKQKSFVAALRENRRCFSRANLSYYSTLGSGARAVYNLFANFAQTQSTILGHPLCLLTLADTTHALPISSLSKDGVLCDRILQVHGAPVLPQPGPELVDWVEVGASSRNVPQLDAELSCTVIFEP